MSLIWTRSGADWDEDRHLLEGVDGVVRVPCLHMVPVAHAAKQYDVYVVVSPHAVAAYSLPPGANVYAFGAKTAAAVERAGGNVALQVARTAADMLPILLRLLDKNKTVGLPGACEPAFDLASALRQGGFRAEAVACYHTVCQALKEDGSTFSAAEAQALAGAWRGVVCFASPSAVKGFTATFPNADLVAACIGPTTADAASKHFKRIAVAPENSLEALISIAKGLAAAEGAR